jgi:hypothetical protein
MRLLVHMALTARDDDPRPRYFAGTEAMAAALGRTPPIDETDRKVVSKALAALRSSGAVVTVERGVIGRRAVYALCLTALPQGDVRLPEVDRSHTNGLPQGEVSDPEGEATDPQGEVTDPEGPPKDNTTTPPPPPAAAAEGMSGDELAAVVMDALPGDLAQDVTRRVLADALAPAAANGWTPETLGAAARSKSWDGARHGGLVVQWAKDLGMPPAPPPTRRVCTVPGCGTGNGGLPGWLPDTEDGMPVRCVACRDHADRARA